MEINHQDCWFRKNCKLGQCDEPVCVRYENMKDMLNHSNLTPSQYNRNSYIFQPTIDGMIYANFDGIIHNELQDWYKEFHSFYFYSNNNLNGKTALAEKILLCYMTLWTKYTFNDHPCGYFITADQIKSLFKTQFDNREAFEQMSHNLKTAELLVIDNVDNIFGDEKVENYLAAILDERYKSNRCIIYTSHTAPEQFLSKSRNTYLQSRVITLSTLVQFNAPPYVQPNKLDLGGIN